MINRFFFTLLFILSTNKLVFYFISKKFKELKSSLDFRKFNFDINKNNKKFFLAKKYLENKYYDEVSINYHNFNWINAAKNIGGPSAISNTKLHIKNWTSKNYRLTTFVWDIEIIAKRLLNLIYNFDFYSNSADYGEKKQFNKIIQKHYWSLLIKLKLDNKLLNRSIEILKSVLLIEQINDFNSKKTIKKILDHIRLQINQYGMHRSMNPCIQAEYLNNLFEIKSIFLFYKIQVPKEIDLQIINMNSVLKNFLHSDGSIALFNGSNNANISSILKIIQLSGDIKTKNLFNVDNGIAILNINKLKIFFDVTKTEDKLINQNMHAGTLSIEISYNKEKIITNCGSVEKRVGKKPEYLRYSAAHSTITINNTNVSELIEKKSYKRAPKNIELIANEDENNFYWEASHDGYKNNFNRIVKRKLTISKKDFYIKGQDTIISTKINKKNDLFNIYFHLTPGCTSLLTNNKESVLIKTKKDNPYIFKSDHKISLGESISIVDGNKIEKTKQILISNYSINQTKTVKWSISKAI